jgi:hypothetical protein
MTSKWIESLAADFWEEVGEEEPFPRSLEHVILMTKPVSITKLSRLCLEGVRDWLLRRRVPPPLETPDRWLNGCLIAYRGMGFIFVEGSLPAEDLRMAIAHEFAHFLAEYELPRERVVRRLGPSVLSILDGDREPTPEEGLGAALAGVELGMHVHYMERAGSGAYPLPTSAVERTANALALELLAPARAVLAELHRDPKMANNAARWPEILQGHFGLPESWARAYARRLAEQTQRQRTFSEILGL